MQFKIWFEQQLLRQQPQITAIKPVSPKPGQPPWPAQQVAQAGQAVVRVGQRAGQGLANQATQQQAGQNMQQQQQMGQPRGMATSAPGGQQVMQPRQQ